MTWKERPIQSVKVPNSDIRYKPLFHWFNVAVAAGYTPTDFFKLSGRDQSYVVAWYEDKQRMQAVESFYSQADRRAEEKRKRASKPLVNR